MTAASGGPARPVLLDLFCCEGGASAGYARAGFDVVGCDLFRHRGPDGELTGFNRARYPFPAHQGDALEVVRRLLAGDAVPFTGRGPDRLLRLEDVAAFAASPPCQTYSLATVALRNAGKEYPDLVAPTRAALVASGLPYVIENVPLAPLIDPLQLCGSEFGLRAIDTDGLPVWLRRHRLFESNVFLLGAGGCRHPDPAVWHCAGVYGNGSPTPQMAKARAGGYTPASIAVRRELMGIDWTTTAGLSQAIPPVYTEHVGVQLLEHLAVADAA